MNFLDAAYEVLKQARKPLHYTEITQRALQAGILDTKGQTPEATMGARLYVDTKRPDSRFERVPGGLFTLAVGRPSEIAQRIADLNRRTREQLHERLMQLPADRFEVLISQLLLALGFNEETIQITPYSNDGGIDVRGVLNAGSITEVNAAVQAKKWRNNVQAPVVTALRGSLVVHEQGIIITTSKFSRGAIEEAQAPGRMRISLVDGDTLLNLLRDHGIGVKAEQHTVYSLDEEWWGEIVTTSRGLEPPSPPPPPLPTVPFPVSIQATVHGQTFFAELLNGKGTVRYDGQEYRSPSRVGQVVTGWKSCNGWTLWRYQHPETGQWRPIEELRIP